MTHLDQGRLCDLAATVAFCAYAPYSRFRVGAALLCQDGTIFTGVNVENRSFGLTICAERSAIVAAVTAGFTEFIALAVAGADSDYPLPPCGACRQVMSEFMAADALVFFRGKDPTAIIESKVGELLPYDSLKELSGGSSR